MANQYRSNHGHSKKGRTNSTYVSWVCMKVRCMNEAHKSYPRYGGRGITICSRWMKYENFLADMGLRPEGFTLDRIDTNGNYEPENCRWASAKQQMDNQRKTVWVECYGEKLTISDWSIRTGLSKETIRRRILKGLPTDVVLGSPARCGVMLIGSRKAKNNG